MTSCEIENYVKTHGHYIDSAIAKLNGRFNRFDLQDVRQELYITMLRCLNNYNPERKIPLDNYVSISIKRRAWGIYSRHNKGARHREAIAASIFDPVYCDSEYLELVDVIAGYEDVSLEDKEIIHEMLGDLPDRLAGIIWDWACGMMQKDIAEKYGEGQTRVSQLIADATRILRHRMEVYNA